MTGDGGAARHSPPASPSVQDVDLLHRSAAAAGASIVSALVVNPLDVVKTRIQIQSTPNYAAAHAADHVILEKWSFAECIPSRARAGAGAGPGPYPFSGTLDALWRIASSEGPASLWRGTRVSLAMSIPMVGIYLPLYDAVLRAGDGSAWAPLVAGTVSRTVAVFATAPFELLARDVPFSALYWGMVEPMRSLLLTGRDAEDARTLFLANITAGGVSGALAGTITTPLDVVKTRVQLAVAVPGQPRRGLPRTLRDIAAREGPGALFRGWSARAGKAAPACAIVLSAYEGIKQWHAS